ncbi:hypothetical protein D3C85_1286100 [compost metagenome]
MDFQLAGVSVTKRAARCRSSTTGQAWRRRASMPGNCSSTLPASLFMLTKMKPAYSSTRSCTRLELALSKLATWSQLRAWASSPSSLKVQAWYGQVMTFFALPSPCSSWWPRCGQTL